MFAFKLLLSYKSSYHTNFRAQDGPRWPQDRPKVARDRTKRKMGQDGRRWAAKWQKMAARSPIERKCYKRHSKITALGPKGVPRRPQDGPKMAQDGPKIAPRRPKRAQDGPRRPKTARTRPKAQHSTRTSRPPAPKSRQLLLRNLARI